MTHFWLNSNAIKDGVFIPKYYDPEHLARANSLAKTHICQTIGQLVSAGYISVSTGDEIGKAAYGTGDIPFVRTSDIANWEIKSAPKQGIAREIYDEYAAKQNVQPGDILLVRDGTYLIGTNCFITAIDKEILYQSHILKIRVNNKEKLDPHLLFLALNNPWVQRQIRSMQFTADIIDTIGQRYLDIVIPIPRNGQLKRQISTRCANALQARMKGKAFVKHCPKMMEEVLRTGSAKPITLFEALTATDVIATVQNETVTAEFGDFTAFWRDSAQISDGIYLPTYYDVGIKVELSTLAKHCDLITIGDLAKRRVVEFHTGDEIGKMAYGTGEIPFLRTSDFANWEINHSPKQGVSQDIFEQYAVKQDVQQNDVLLVRDGTYLVGSSCIVTEEDVTSLYCGGLFKFRMNDHAVLDPFLFLGLMNSYIVKRQIRTKQFTRDVIDTLGNRIEEVVLPIPKSAALRKAVSQAIERVVRSRIQARTTITRLANEICPT